ncbi:helix-turn-helix domain-containing protein [Rhodococcus sp. IEGM 1241]|uniref:helix-turn-helix domain-containing protein n=1 Tax=Rhodococcus sp. IEGM 1241 TaxID=3082228 RepID=UPI003989F102
MRRTPLRPSTRTGKGGDRDGPRPDRTAPRRHPQLTHARSTPPRSNWRESAFNSTSAAQRVHIHRNTLTYRLQKMERAIDDRAPQSRCT